MCGRYVSVSSPEQLAERFRVDEVRTPDLGRRYNVAPTLPVYAVIEHDASRRLGTLRWGFVPPWSKDPRRGPSPINARIEGIAESRMFARSFVQRRCIVPADGFYEWQERGEGRRKQPYYLHDPSDEALALAGIWTSWRDPSVEDAEPLFSCAIVTMAARGEIERIHERMPVVLPASLWAEWLTAPPEAAATLHGEVEALDPPGLRAERISDRVNNVRNEGPELLEPGEVTDEA
jgi:putative SOS response-associated peptidase YedK